jgi:hypothetical protein
VHALTTVPLGWAALLLTVACDRSPSYHGDGTLTDMGPSAAHERYVVDLGAVDLSGPNRRSFKMVGLPRVEFTMGLRQVNVAAGCDAAALDSVRVRLDVSSQDSAIVVAEEGPLSTWVKSSSLVYRRGAERQEPEAGGAVKYVPTGVRASGGWGTYFTPRTSAAYLATFAVLDAHGARGCESRLVGIGGGWK